MSYEAFAYYYDSLMDQNFYNDYIQFINEHVKDYQTVLELGCGTGEIAIRLAHLGKQAFENTYNALKKGGSFIFDIDSMYKMETILKDYDEENDEDDFYFHWHVDRISKGYVKHSVEIIDKVENDRVYEEHYQKTYDVETYIELLEKIGFKNIKLYSDFSKYGTECERVIFVCQKG